MSITAAPEKRTLASASFSAYTFIIFLAGVALLYLGMTWQPWAGLFFYPALGLALVAAGVLLLRRRRVGLWIFGIALLASWVWSMVGHRYVGSSDATPPVPAPALTSLPLTAADLTLVGMAALGLILLAYWPVARRRLVGVAKPGYFIINGVLPLAILTTLAVTRLA